MAKLQKQAFKTESEVIAAGGSVSDLLNDTQIYVSSGGINKTLDDAISDGDVVLDASVVMRAYKNGGSITANTTIASWTEEKDTALSFDPSTGIFTVVSAGDYLVGATIQRTAASDGVLAIRKNGSIIATGSTDLSSLYDDISTLVIDCAVGDTITITYSNSVTAASNINGTVLSIFKITKTPQNYSPLICYIKDVKSSGSAGGAFTSGSYQTRVLNTVEGDNSFISLSSNQFTLSAGQYHIDAVAPSYRVDRNKLKLRNITDSTDVLLGNTAYSANADDGTAVSVTSLRGVFTITASKAFEIQHRCQTTNGSTGFGLPSSFGDNEIYTQVKLTKVL